AQHQVSEVARRYNTPDLVCLNGYDMLAAGPAIDASAARLSPGGTRWTADRWSAASQAPASFPTSAT
ncbi:MAG: hypothetical protein ACLQBX_08990, partial [Candidatus Limnocylindrales bacterium]